MFNQMVDYTAHYKAVYPSDKAALYAQGFNEYFIIFRLAPINVDADYELEVHSLRGYCEQPDDDTWTYTFNSKVVHKHKSEAGDIPALLESGSTDIDLFRYFDPYAI